MQYTRPRRPSEATVQALFYKRCLELKIPCDLEYKVRGARFDAVIHNYKDIICIVEMKNLSPNAIRRRLSGDKIYKQDERYRAFNVPLVHVYDTPFIEEAIEDIMKIISERGVK